jgi:hypothetical protein
MRGVRGTVEKDGRHARLAAAVSTRAAAAGASLFASHSGALAAPA